MFLIYKKEDKKLNPHLNNNADSDYYTENSIFSKGSFLSFPSEIIAF